MQVKSPKPAPDIFLEAAGRLGVAPSECLVIEDSCNGLNAARSAGMARVAFYNPHSGKPADGFADILHGRGRSDGKAQAGSVQRGHQLSHKRDGGIA